mmetsp:Transcript_17715/g.12640  ORF Transcript_17715/g.12640 Transcript_17715/m.12640 type:complete len:86 (-) Transcript_17715:55-312(-)
MTRMTNPDSWIQSKYSLKGEEAGKLMKKTQTTNVLQVSIVDLCAADAYFVTATPHPLKPAIEKQMPTLSQISTLLSQYCSNAIVV